MITISEQHPGENELPLFFFSTPGAAILICSPISPGKHEILFIHLPRRLQRLVRWCACVREIVRKTRSENVEAIVRNNGQWALIGSECVPSSISPDAKGQLYVTERETITPTNTTGLMCREQQQQAADNDAPVVMMICCSLLWSTRKPQSRVPQPLECYSCRWSFFPSRHDGSC